MKTAASLFCLALSLALAQPATAANWPCFRGPDGAASSEDAQIPVTWSDTQNLRWKLDLPGPGSSSPIVWEDRIFLTYFTGQKDDGDVSGLSRHVICVDKKTGQLLWDKGFPGSATEDPWQGNIKEHGYTSNTPITDGQRVYVHFGKGGVVALDFQGNVLWQSPTGKDSNRMRWGSAGSPILWKNLFIVNASDEAQALIAFDTSTGKKCGASRRIP